VKHLVVLSGPAEESFPGILPQQCRDIERYAHECGVPFTILRVNFFYENIMLWKDHVNHGFLPWPLQPEIGLSDLAVGDVGLAAAHVLANYEKHLGRTYVLSGPEELTGPQRAEILSKELGKHVEYQYMPERELKEVLLQSGFQEWQAQGMVDLFGLARSGVAEKKTEDYAEITGLAAQPFEAWLRGFRHLLLADHAPTPQATAP